MTQPTHQILAPALGKQCAGRIWNGPVYPARPCKRPASFHEDGEDWCVGHSKATKKARADKKFAQWQVGQGRRLEQVEREVAEHAALAGIANPAAVPELVRVAKGVLDLLDGYAPDLSLCMTRLSEAIAALDKKGKVI